MPTIQKHRCAVCWQEQPTHDDWFKHATEEHGSVLAEFGYAKCEHESYCPMGCREHTATCPGIQHQRRLPNYGTPSQRRRPEPAPFKAKDGTTYIPVPLFSPEDAA